MDNTLLSTLLKRSLVFRIHDDHTGIAKKLVVAPKLTLIFLTDIYAAYTALKNPDKNPIQ